MDVDATQFSLIQCIVAHPEERPSESELEQMNPSLDSKKIQRELDYIADHGVVEKVDVGGETRYRLTNDGREELEGTGLFSAEGTLKHYYGKTG